MKIKLFLTFLLASLSLQAQWTPLTNINTEVATSNSDDMKVLGNTKKSLLYTEYFQIPLALNLNLYEIK